MPNVVWHELKLGDLDEDGTADAAFFGASLNGSSFYVALGSRDGTFGPPITFPYTSNPTPELGVNDLTIVDLDGDGHLDIVFSNDVETGENGELAVALGNGDGTFAEPVSYPTATRPIAVAAGDLDEDGTPEVVVVAGHWGNNTSWSTVDVLHYLGAGMLGTAESYPMIGHGGGTLEVTDINGDARVDVVVGSEDTLEVLATDSTGALTASVSYDTGSGLFAAGDFDGDGDTDLAVSQVNGPAGPAIALFANNGGVFTETTHAPATLPSSVHAADLNGDGKPDLVVLDRVTYAMDSNFIATYINNGDGTFAPEVTHRSFDRVDGFAVGDIDGDGHVDFAELGYLDEALVAHIGRGDGGFYEPVRLQGHSVIATGDVNLDGNPDVITTSDAQGGNILVSLGNGDGSFQPAATIGYSSPTSSAALGDVSGDGKPDLVVFGYGVIVTYVGAGDGSFSAAHTYHLPATGIGGPLALADFNGDCLLDVVVLSRAMQGPNPKPGFLAVFLSVGDGTYDAGRFFPAADVLSVADFNGDRYADIAAEGLSSTSLMLSYGDGSFQTLSANVGGWCVGDFNADTNADILGDGALALGNGDGTFTLHATSNIGGPTCIAVDLNGDGAADLADANHVWINNGSAAFGQPGIYVYAGYFTPPYFFGAADFDRDGHPDLVLSEGYTESPFGSDVLLARCLP